MSWFGEILGGAISTSDLLIYGSYFNTFLLALKAILFVIAEFMVRPTTMSKLNFFDRVRATLIPLKDESSIFAGEIKKLKTFRVLWATIFALLFLRILVGYYLGRLEFA